MILTLAEAKRMMAENNGNLDLTNAHIKELPEGLTYIDGNLDLTDSDIERLPDGLTVTGWVDLGGSHISVLPDNMYVGDSLFVVRGMSMKNLPRVKQLPKNLHVEKNLIILDTDICRTPPDLYVGGGLYLARGISSWKHAHFMKSKKESPNNILEFLDTPIKWLR